MDSLEVLSLSENPIVDIDKLDNKKLIYLYLGVNPLEHYPNTRSAFLLDDEKKIYEWYLKVSH
jgi:Leucine-rich repeat (LRR) protein